LEDAARRLIVLQISVAMLIVVSMVRRWLVALPSLIAAVAIGIGAWRIADTRSELRSVQRQLVRVTKSDALKLAAEKAKLASEASALAAVRRTISSSLDTTTTTQPREAPFAFVDVSTLDADLSAAVGGADDWPLVVNVPCIQQAFVNEFTAKEQQQAALAEQGKPYYVPDPESEAAAFVAPWMASGDFSTIDATYGCPDN
jgi:hypothetical protein